eukprot:Tbor_TRINITY_DN6143_c1_g1::TRINITY_DN6143_c1_g1_i1::g.21366::m.21366
MKNLNYWTHEGYKEILTFLERVYAKELGDKPEEVFVASLPPFIHIFFVLERRIFIRDLSKKGLHRLEFHLCRNPYLIDSIISSVYNATDVFEVMELTRFFP